MQREKEKKVFNRSGRSTERKKVRFLLGGRVFVPGTSGENAAHFNHGSERSRRRSHNQAVQPPNLTKTETYGEGGHRKEVKPERDIHRGNKRPRPPSHIQSFEPSNGTGVDTDTDSGREKEAKRGHNRDRGDERSWPPSQKQAVEPSYLTKADTNGDGGYRKEVKPEQKSHSGYKRPRLPPLKQSLEPSNETGVETDASGGHEKEAQRQHSSDRGNERSRPLSHKQAVEPSNLTKVGTNEEGGRRKKREQNSYGGNERPRPLSYKKSVEPSIVAEVETVADGGHTKEEKSKHSSNRGRSLSHERAVRPSNETEVDKNGGDESRKEMRREKNSDRGAGHWDLNDRTSSSSKSLQIYPPNCPALKITWRGFFEVIGTNPEEDMHCEEFLAHLAARVSLKAYEFSKNFPKTMQLRMYPRHEVWPESFQTACPNSFDIALYFYPEMSERSKKMYAQILKYLEAKDMALRARMGDVELLVFASKLLDMDSQKVNGSYFLWGVFCRLKNKES